MSWKVLTTVALAASTALSPVGGAPVDGTPTVPPAEPVAVGLVTSNGSGCPQGSTTVWMAAGNSAVKVRFGAFLVQVGLGARPTDFRASCQLAVQLEVPAGFSYSVRQAEFTGWAELAKGARAVARAELPYFGGTLPPTTISTTLTGPLESLWHLDSPLDPSTQVWSPCGAQRLLNLTLELRAYAGTSDPKKTSFVVMDETDIEAAAVYQLDWKSCPT